MNEKNLIALLKTDKLKAAEKITELFGNRLLRSAFLLSGNEHDAQDLVQDTFIEAMKSADKFRGDSALYTWLYGILFNINRNFQRKKRLIYTDDIPEKSVSGNAGLAIDQKISAKILMEAIQQLPDTHREIIILRYYEHMNIDVIAEKTGIKKGTVKSRLHYAVKDLRKIIPKELNLFASDNT
jgi:RNA polymerase sigma-70 factor, ECF subfamily